MVLGILIEVSLKGDIWKEEKQSLSNADIKYKSNNFVYLFSCTFLATVRNGTLETKIYSALNKSANKANDY